MPQKRANLFFFPPEKFPRLSFFIIKKEKERKEKNPASLTVTFSDGIKIHLN